jgi:hypothetical protein
MLSPQSRISGPVFEFHDEVIDNVPVDHAKPPREEIQSLQQQYNGYESPTDSNRKTQSSPLEPLSTSSLSLTPSSIKWNQFLKTTQPTGTRHDSEEDKVTVTFKR